MNPLPVMKTMCPTCPFREGSKYACLVPHLAASALSEASRICHSTGDSGIMGDTGKPERICRGSRDLQLRFFVAQGFLSEPTDEAWAAKIAELQAEKEKS